ARNNQPAEAPTPQAVDSTSEAKPKVVELDGQKIRLSPSQQSVLQKANEKYPGKISADRLNGISQNTLNSLREKGLLEESGNVYNRSFKISSKGRRVNRRVLASEKEDTKTPEPESPATPEAPKPTPQKSEGRITDPKDLDSRPEGSRIQISQNNKTRIAEKGEDG